MVASERTVGLQWAPKGEGTEEERFDRALVNGLMLEVILETSSLQGDPNIRRNLVKTRLKSIMVTHLAGRVTLERFRHLLRELDHCFPQYYPLMASGSLQSPIPVAGRTRLISSPPVPAPPTHPVLREEVLKAWLEAEI